MSAISSGVSRYASADRRSSVSTSVGSASSSREEELVRQLDARLSGRLAHIRTQITAPIEPNPPSPDGTGRIVDIHA
ncbi:MAG TPA: hypothetical protein VFB21_21945 [Chthonomonadaceae bacterium]|nr:hypothetical protein [Chthonomonadaceae bacterium]